MDLYQIAAVVCLLGGLFLAVTFVATVALNWLGNKSGATTSIIDKVESPIEVEARKVKDDQASNLQKILWLQAVMRDLGVEEEAAQAILKPLLERHIFAK